jgi:hypothetical protein
MTFQGIKTYPVKNKLYQMIHFNLALVKRTWMHKTPTNHHHLLCTILWYHHNCTRPKSCRSKLKMKFNATRLYYKMLWQYIYLRTPLSFTRFNTSFSGCHWTRFTSCVWEFKTLAQSYSSPSSWTEKKELISKGTPSWLAWTSSL